MLLHHESFELGVAFLVLHEQVHLELSVACAFGNTLCLEVLERLALQTMCDRILDAERLTFGFVFDVALILIWLHEQLRQQSRAKQ